MRLLFDQNLSHRLVALLEDVFPDSLHVRQLNLHESDDEVIWEYARMHDLVIVTQDSDYADWNKIRGAPPHLIWLRCGNTSVTGIHHKIRGAVERIVLMENKEVEIEIVEIW